MDCDFAEFIVNIIRIARYICGIAELLVTIAKTMAFISKLQPAYPPIFNGRLFLKRNILFYLDTAWAHMVSTSHPSIYGVAPCE